MSLRDEMIARLRRDGYTEKQIADALGEGGREDFETSARRFIEAEAADPQGFFTPGGATAGGIFGEAPIAFGGDVSYDPASVGRSAQTMSALEMAQMAREQRLMLAEQRRLVEENRQLRAQAEARRIGPRVVDHDEPADDGLLGSVMRRLGRKR